MKHARSADDATEGQGASSGRDATRTHQGHCARAKVQGGAVRSREGEVSRKADGVIRRERQVAARRVIEAEARAFQQVEDTRTEGTGVIQAEATLAND